MPDKRDNLLKFKNHYQGIVHGDIDCLSESVVNTHTHNATLYQKHVPTCILQVMERNTFEAKQWLDKRCRDSAPGKSTIIDWYAEFNPLHSSLVTHTG